MSSLAYRSATELAALIKRKQISSRELLDLWLARIERLNPRLNAVISLDIPAAKKRAREADQALSRGELWGPLHGVPMTIKDSFDVAGMPSTWGVPELKDNYPARHALAVEKFLDAGAIVFGKTNVAAYLIGWITKNDDLRRDEQSVGRVALARRLLGRFGGGARGRPYRARYRRRFWRRGAQCRALLRHLGA